MNCWIVLIILVAGMTLSVWFQKLSMAAAIVGGIIGYSIFMGAGYTGLAILTAFFLTGTAATSWKMNRKKTQGFAESHNGKRMTGQVIANAGVAGGLALVSWIFPQGRELFIMMIASAFSSATADTLSSELGNVYGTRFYNILSFKKDQKGLNGVISMEGMLFGIAGSALIAFIYAAGMGFNKNILWIILAGTIGNITDSILGATLERRQFLNNNAVNFLNTLAAAAFVYAAHFIS
ncbi:MAG: DUF92 domain-containing protein [Flavitalea sp.]